MTKRSPFRYFRTSPEVIRLAVMMYVRFPLSLRNVEDLLHERGIDVCHETIRLWWNRFGPMFAAEIRKKRAEQLRSRPQWRWHLDEMFVSYAGFWVTRSNQAARFSATLAATPSVNVTPSMTKGNWFAPFRRRHVLAAA